MTKYDLYKSITLFLLYQVPENTSASDVEIYKVWRNMSGNFLVDDTFVASLLEYVHAKKHEDRNVMKALAQIDGFISNFNLLTNPTIYFNLIPSSKPTNRYLLREFI